MDMRTKRLTYVLLLLALVTLPQLAMAAWNPEPMSADQNNQALSSQMSDCKSAQTTSLSDMEQQTMMAPMEVPVQTQNDNGAATITTCSAAQEPPAEVTSITILTPLTFEEINGAQCLNADVDEDMANSVVLIPMSCAGQSMMQPMQLKPSGDFMLLVPLNPASIQSPASVAILVGGDMNMVPINTSNMSNGLSVSADQQGQTKVMCDQK